MSTTPAALFREIHRLRRFIRDLQEQLDRAPRQHKIQQAKVTRQEEAQRDNQDAIKKLKLAILDKEGSLKATHGQIAKHLKQMETAGSKKEYDAFQLELKNEHAQVAKLEDEILAALAEAEERTAKLPEFEDTVKKARAEFAEWDRGAGERLAGWQVQLADAQAQLKAAEDQLPRLGMEAYNRMVNAMGPDALSPVENRICVACATEITAQNQNDLMVGTFVTCKACGRILYLPQ